jgi:hypothetical protein
MPLLFSKIANVCKIHSETANCTRIIILRIDTLEYLYIVKKTAMYTYMPYLHLRKWTCRTDVMLTETIERSSTFRDRDRLCLTRTLPSLSCTLIKLVSPTFNYGFARHTLPHITCSWHETKLVLHPRHALLQPPIAQNSHPPKPKIRIQLALPRTLQR